ncbi:MAG: Crp/Fnr family transcriptional regulator [Flavobacteriaceae bacterium]|nr:Crp/Fnr family transcriptional regulator [Flavobacteriaceae bacterium]
MKNLIKHIKSRITITKDEVNLIEKHFVYEDVSAQTNLLKAGGTEGYINFLSTGIVKGYQNIDGKLIVQYLVSENEFFTSLDSFMHQTPSVDNFEAITNCKLLKISKPDFDILKQSGDFWTNYVEIVTNEHLNRKLERAKDFQILTAKERYLKFINNSPQMALNVSIENIASFLGMEPQSLSRIRKQITF